MGWCSCDNSFRGRELYKDLGEENVLTVQDLLVSTLVCVYNHKRRVPHGNMPVSHTLVHVLYT